MKGSKIVLSLLAVLTLVSMIAVAGDVSGTWKSTFQGPNGAIERTFVLKQDGNKLTGKLVTSAGTSRSRTAKWTETISSSSLSSPAGAAAKSARPPTRVKSAAMRSKEHKAWATVPRSGSLPSRSKSTNHASVAARRL